MNPNLVIRPWLLLAGKQFGINHAYDYRLEDAETATHKMYFTYRLMDSEDVQETVLDTSSADGYDVQYEFQGEFYTNVIVDLWHSQNGLEELACAILLAKKLQALRMLWRDNACSYHRLITLSNMTEFNNEEELVYHQRMVVSFTENIKVTMDPSIGLNDFVEQVDLNLESGGQTYEITRTGITVT